MTRNQQILIEIVERLTRIEEQVKSICKHTDASNKEMGELRDKVTALEGLYKELSNKFFIRLSWKQIAAIVGGVSGLVTIIRTIIQVIWGV